MATGQQLIDAARKYLGVKYVFGGTTAKGLDCSGLIVRALDDVKARGSFPRVSADQIKACTPITVEEALRTPGALVWFDGHDALTIGDGKTTIEAVVNPGNKVAIFNAPNRWKKAGLIPGITYGKKADPVANKRPYAVSPHEGRYTSGFDRNRYIIYQGKRTFSPHLGLDVAPPVPGTVGTPVYAMFAGVVEGVVHGRKPGQPASQGAVVRKGYSGNGGRVANPDGERQVYVHVNFVVGNGTKVQAGDLLGYTDRSGIQTGPHMHLTCLNKRGVEYDPILAFNRWKIKVGEKPKFTSAVSKPAPKPPVQNKVDPKVLKRQQDLNKYADAGVFEDGVDGPVMKAWDKWVEDAQRSLNAFKSSHPNLVLDKHYGPVMAAYVRDVQQRNTTRRNPIVADGILGPVMVRWMRSKGSPIPNRPKNRP